MNYALTLISLDSFFIRITPKANRNRMIPGVYRGFVGLVSRIVAISLPPYSASFCGVDSLQLYALSRQRIFIITIHHHPQQLQTHHH